MMFDYASRLGVSLPYLTHYLFNLAGSNTNHKHKLLMLDRSNTVTRHICDPSEDTLEVFCYICKYKYTFFVQTTASGPCVDNNPTHVFVCEKHTFGGNDTSVEIRCANCPLNVMYLQPTPLFPQEEIEFFSSNYPDLDAKLTALKLISTYLSNIFDGEKRSINTENQNLVKKLGWNDNTRLLFERLGFEVKDKFIFPPPSEELSRSKEFYLAFKLEIYRIALLHGKDEFLKDSFFISANQKVVSLLGGYPPRHPKGIGSIELTLNPDQIQPPYSHLHCTSDLSDQVLLLFHRHLAQKDSRRQPVLVDALADAAQAQGSEVLGEETMLMQSQGIIGERERQSAYNYIDISDDEIDDHEVIRKYNAKVQSDPLNESQYRQNLKTIAMVRGTLLLNRFIESGALPEPDLPTGLNNIGNTCYLNSLLQYYYSLGPLYNRVMNFSPDNITTPKTPLVVDERPVSEEEVQQAHLFATHLKALFIILSENNGHLSVSPSQQLALMALGHMDVQPIHQDIDSVVNSMRQATKADNAPQSLQPLSTPKEPGNISPSPLQSPLVGNSVPGDSNTKDLTEAQDTPDNNTDLIDLNSDEPAPSAPSPMDIGEKSPMDESMVVEETLALGSQQDVSECMDHMMRLMERSFLSQPNQPDSNLIKELFYGKTRQIIKYVNPKTGELVKSTKLEEFSNLILNIQDRSCGLYDCLDEYFQTSKVEMTDVEADRELAIESAPPFLQIQLQRVQFDPKLLQAYKSQAYIELTDTLHLDWYTTKYVDQLESNSQSPHFRQEAMKIRDIIRESKDKVKFLNGNRNNYTYGESLSKTINYYETQLKEYDQKSTSPLAEYLEPLPEPSQLDQTLKILNNHSNHLNAVIEQNTQHMELGEKQLQSILSQTKDLPYHLHAVFIHSGLASFGHYWIYIKDWKKNRWLKYNDEFVSEVPKEEIFKDTTDLTANPYYVVYIREDLKNQI